MFSDSNSRPLVFSSRDAKKSRKTVGFGGFLVVLTLFDGIG